jgi:carbon-monoxide dehydrogenase medium subunit
MLPEFELFEPRDLKEAVTLLAELGEGARPLAGGTDLMVQMEEGRTRPEYIVDIKDLEELKGVAFSESGLLVIGALTTLRSLETSSVVREKFPILHDAVSHMGSVQIRNRGTIGGNLCNAHPPADGTAALMALGARLRVHGPQGEREIAVESFFPGPFKTALNAGEILTHVQVSTGSHRTGGAYAKYTVRKAMDPALVGVGVFLQADPDGAVCREARIALATAGPTPCRALRAEETLKGRPLGIEAFEQAGEAAAEEASPVSSWRAAEDYSRQLIKVLLPDVAQAAWRRLGGQGRK